MDELVKWYWDHGVKRGNDPHDPDQMMRRISVGGWLDPIVRILERGKAIHSNANGKACLALWGPSQAGKSTMLSRYVDGTCVDGIDSALTWSEKFKTRFSPPEHGIDYLRSVAPETLVFNPFNHKSDASGLVTRYTLKDASDESVNPEFPIEIKFTTRAQIIQSLSLGYFSECKPIEEREDFTQAVFMEKIPTGEAVAGTPEAYWLLKDIANVIEFMKGQHRFINLFRRSGEWDRIIRKTLVSSPALCTDVAAAEKFMAEIFWDSSDVLTKFYHKAADLLNTLENEWKGCRICATMEVGALLLDIDSFRSFDSPDGEKGKTVQEKVSQLAYEKTGNEVHVFLRSGGSKIAGDAFGYFQAICAELIVPLKKDNLEHVPSKHAFVELAEKCDVLDFPGVSNKNTGNDGSEGSALKIDLAQVKETEIFTKVFKQGKTQCFVYNYADKYGIDAFAILVRSDAYPSQSSVLSSGIKEWLCSFDPNWTPGRKAEMPIFVNMTFFASLINSVALSGVGKGLTPYIERIQELTFARKESARFFATTYQQFPGGKIDHPEQEESTVKSILSDLVFTPSTGLTEENIRAVYSNDGGLDYMLSRISEVLDRSRRISRCRSILDQDKREVRRLIEDQLPSNEEVASDRLRDKLRECRETVEARLREIEEVDDVSKYRQFALCVKNLLSVPPEIFDPIPQHAADMSRKAITDYIKTQTGKWFEHKNANLGDDTFLSIEQMKTILSALRDSVDEESLFQLIRSRLGQINSRVLADAARYPFALAFGNLLQKGKVHVESDSAAEERNPPVLDTFIEAAIEKDSSRGGSPYCHVILTPFISKLESLAQTGKAKARPPQEGDSELKEIFDKIETSMFFQIL